MERVRTNDYARRNRKQSKGASEWERLRREKVVPPVQELEHGRALADLEDEDGWS